MSRDEALELLLGGTDGILNWNRRRKAAKTAIPNLRGVDLKHANLTDANLTKMQLGGVDFRHADLTDANLAEANLGMADFRQSTLKRANFTEADLNRVDFNEADLRYANLTGADLTSARFVRANLSHTLVEDAIVQDTQIFQLTGLPVPAKSLWLGLTSPYMQISGDEAMKFFIASATVEVFLTHALLDAEFGGLHFHFGEVRANGVATDVYLIGHRHEAGGSVLRFQGPTYDAVYSALPDLLAVFRTTVATDWKRTFDGIPQTERDQAISAIVRLESRLKTGRWRLAERLADAFAGFANARVVKLAEGRKKGVSITVFSDEALLEKLTRTTLPSGATSAALVFQGPSTHYHGDTFNITGHVTGAALGRDAKVAIGQLNANIPSQSASSQDPKPDQPEEKP